MMTRNRPNADRHARAWPGVLVGALSGGFITGASAGQSPPEAKVASAATSPALSPALPPLPIPAAPRDDVNSLWEPLALPMSVAEAQGTARRLGLTHEQVIAFERAHEAYLREALAQRTRAVDGLLALGSDVMRIPNVLVPLGEMRKAIAQRKGWLSALGVLDDSLLGALGEILSGDQKEGLDRERLRRERARLASDAWVARWWSWSHSPWGYQLPARAPLREPADLLADVPLAPERQAEVHAALVDVEWQLTRQLREVFEAACAGREQMARYEGRLFVPEHHESIQGALVTMVVPAIRLVQKEAEAVDRLLALLPPETAEQVQMRYLRLIANDDMVGWDLDLDMFRAALERAEVTAEERAKIAALRDEFVSKTRALWPAILKANRSANVTSPTIGGWMVMPDSLPEDLRPTWPSLDDLERKARDDLRALLGDERFQPLIVQQNEAISALRDRVLDRAYAPDANLVLPGPGVMPNRMMPRIAGASDVALVLRRLNVNENSAAIITALNEDRAAAWNKIIETAHREINRMLQPQTIDDQASVSGSFARCRQALAELAENDASYADALRTALGTADGHAGSNDQAITVLRLQRTWSVIVAAPPQLPPASNSGLTRSVVKVHLERVNPVNALLQADAPMDDILPAFRVLDERTPDLADAAMAFRRAIFDALEAAQLVTAALRSDPARDWQRTEPLRKRQTEAAMEARRLRGAFMRQLAELHENVAAALGGDGDLVDQYRHAVQSIGYPSAVRGMSDAERVFSAAARLDDLTPSQRERLAAAAAEHRRQMQAAADDVAAAIDQHAAADDDSPEAPARCAAAYARLEQALFAKDQRCAAALARVRSILTAAQVLALESRSIEGP